MKKIKVSNSKMNGTFRSSNSQGMNICLHGEADVDVESLFSYLWEKITSKITNPIHDFYYVSKEGNEYILVGIDEMPRGSDLTKKIKVLDGENLELYLSYKKMKKFVKDLGE